MLSLGWQCRIGEGSCQSTCSTQTPDSDALQRESLRAGKSFSGKAANEQLTGRKESDKKQLPARVYEATSFLSSLT